jgi:hypothetical protein
MAVPDTHEQSIAVGVRQWRSFDRRNRRKHPTRDDRVEDLARGLWQAFEPGDLKPGPELQDYRCVARALADVLDPPTPTA